MNTTRILSSLGIACTTLLVSTPWLCAQTSTTPQDEASLILRQTCDFLKAQKAFTFDANITYDNILESGQKVQYSAYQKVLAQRPNQLRADYIGDQRSTRFYYDGKTVTLLSTDKNLYVTKPASSTIDATLEHIEQQYGISLPLSNLVASDPCNLITPNISSETYVGLNRVNQVLNHHLLFTGQDKDWQLWVSEGAQPVPRKVVITYKNLPGSPQYTAVLSNWNFQPKIPTDTFTFKPPVGASKIDILSSENTSGTNNKELKR